jgi:hypothetical protein
MRHENDQKTKVRIMSRVSFVSSSIFFLVAINQIGTIRFLNDDKSQKRVPHGYVPIAC